MNYSRTYKLLIVEDNPVDAGVLKKVISKNFHYAYKLKIVNSLGKAISEMTYRKESYDMILLDLNLSDSRGICTLQSFREYCDNIPIIVVSSISDNKVIRQALINGASSYVVKGKDKPKEIINEVHHVLDNNKFLTRQNLL